MSSTDLLFKRIQKHIGELAPSRKAYVNAIQTPENQASIFQTLIEDDHLDPDIIAKAMALAKSTDVAKADEIDPERATILGQGRDGVIVYEGVAYMVNPYDATRLRSLQTMLEKGDIHYRRSGVISISVFKDPRFASRIDGGNGVGENETVDDDQNGRAKASKLIDKIIEDAYLRNATDIHISGSKNHGDVRVRIDGKVRPLTTFDITLYENLSTVLHEMTNSQIMNPSRPHSADLSYTCSDGQVLSLRLESLKHQSSRKLYRKISIRILGAGGSFKSLDQLGFTSKNLQRVMSVTRRPKGLFLVTGPTGAGKSTTLGAMTSTMYTQAPDKAYYSLEHPVEVEHKGIWQMPIEGDLTFEEALESILRQDPDVVMVGEIRSKATASLAVQAAMTGHVVLATLHTNDAHGVVPRLLNLGISAADLADVLIGSSGQLLVPTLCKHCSQKKAFVDVQEDLKDQLPLVTQIKSQWVAPHDQVGVRNPKGCEACHHSGISGRASVFECFLSDRPFRSELLKGFTGLELRAKGIESGSFEVMWLDGLRLLKEGIVSVEELFRVLDEAELQDLLELSH